MSQPRVTWSIQVDMDVDAWPNQSRRNSRCANASKARIRARKRNRVRADSLSGRGDAFASVSLSVEGRECSSAIAPLFIARAAAARPRARVARGKKDQRFIEEVRRKEGACLSSAAARAAVPGRAPRDRRARPRSEER